MAEVNKIAEIAADGVADGMHIVGEEALAAEQVVRGLEKIQLGYIALGVAAGAALGAVIGFRVAYRQAETKYSQIADDEIAEMRQYYNDKVVALDSSVKKADLEEIVRERGYSTEPETTEPPMAVTAPTAVVEAAKDVAENEDAAAGESPDDEGSEPEDEVRNIFREAEVVDTWDEHKERRNRSPLTPYVIHRDERDAVDVYDSVTFTYYEADDVLCNERDEVIAGPERDKLIGEANLEKFGHGSGDASIVYIRNDQLEMDLEVIHSPNSYAEEVHGFDPPEIRHAHRRGRASFDDE